MRNLLLASIALISGSLNANAQEPAPAGTKSNLTLKCIVAQRPALSQVSKFTEVTATFTLTSGAHSLDLLSAQGEILIPEDNKAFSLSDSSYDSETEQLVLSGVGSSVTVRYSLSFNLGDALKSGVTAAQINIQKGKTIPYPSSPAACRVVSL